METVVDRAKRLRAQDTTTLSQDALADMDDMAEGMLHRANKSPSDYSSAGAGTSVAAPSVSGIQEAAALAAGNDFAAAVRSRCLTEGVANGLQPVRWLESATTLYTHGAWYWVCSLQHISNA